MSEEKPKFTLEKFEEGRKIMKENSLMEGFNVKSHKLQDTGWSPTVQNNRIHFKIIDKLLETK